jgi:hypothetical protein
MRKSERMVHVGFDAKRQPVYETRPHYDLEAHEEEQVANGVLVPMLTGPVAGVISVGDAAYDVTDEWILVQREHVGPLHVAIHKAHHASGRLLERWAEGDVYSERDPKTDMLVVKPLPKALIGEMKHPGPKLADVSLAPVEK